MNFACIRHRTRCLLFVMSLAACHDNPTAKTDGASENAERGRQQIGAFGCGACHVVDGVPNAIGRVGPSLHGFGSRVLIAGVLPNTAQNLQRWLVNPPAFSPGTAMPKLGIDKRTAIDMSAYLRSLR